jgi:hypothetical protein
MATSSTSTHQDAPNHGADLEVGRHRDPPCGPTKIAMESGGDERVGDETVE